MAPTTLKPLKEHLQEKQEPFMLDVYLSERQIMLNKNLKTLTRFIPTNHKLKVQKHEAKSKINGGHQQEKNQIETMTEKNPVLASLGCTKRESRTSQTLYCSLKEQEMSTDVSVQWRREEENKHNSPVSVLYQCPSAGKVFPYLRGQEEAASTSNTILTRSTNDSSILSALVWELQIQSLLQNLSNSSFTRIPDSTGSALSQQLRNKSIMKQNRKLFLDCIREATEKHQKKKRRYAHAQEIIDLKELGRVVSEEILSWVKQTEEPQTNHDISHIVEDWDFSKQDNTMVIINIGDAIMNDIIQEAIQLFL